MTEEIEDPITADEYLAIARGIVRGAQRNGHGKLAYDEIYRQMEAVASEMQGAHISLALLEGLVSEVMDVWVDESGTARWYPSKRIDEAE